MDTKNKNFLIWKLMQTFGFNEEDLKRDYFSLSWDETYTLWNIAELSGIRPNKLGWSRARVLWNRMQKYVEGLPF